MKHTITVEGVVESCTRTMEVLKSSENAVLKEYATVWNGKLYSVFYYVNDTPYDNYILALRDYAKLSNMPFNLDNIIN
jgi:hypothetical protein